MLEESLRSPARCNLGSSSRVQHLYYAGLWSAGASVVLPAATHDGLNPPVLTFPDFSPVHQVHLLVAPTRNFKHEAG